MLYDIIAVEPRADFKVWVRFEDGAEGEADLSDLAGRGVFKRWTADPSEFFQVAIDPRSGTLVWPGGLDVAPDRLYHEVTRGAGSSSKSQV